MPACFSNNESELREFVKVQTEVNHRRAFIISDFKVMDMTNDGRYYVVTENGTYIDITLKGAIWKFELIEDEKEEREEKEDILFEIESLINQLNNEFNKLKKLI